MSLQQNVSFETNITATPGGTQATSRVITATSSHVTTVATAADSVKLPPAVAGKMLFVYNGAAANSMNVFPESGDAINALAANAAFAVAANKAVQFIAVANGRWATNLTA